MDDYSVKSRKQQEEEAYTASESDSDDAAKGRRRRSSRLSSTPGKYLDDEKDGRASKRRKLADKQEWTMSERKKVQEGVLTFGRPCWKEIKVRRGLERRSLAEIRAYALAFLSQCVRYTNNVEDKETFEDCLNYMKTQGRKYSGKGGILSEEDLKATDDDDFTDTDEVEVEDIVIKKGKGKRATKRKTRSKSNYPTLEDPQYIQNIKRKSKAWAKRLALLKRLRFEMERFDDVNDFELPQNWLSGRRQNPTHWWGAQEDRDLLVGAYRHGFGCFEHIYNDESLCFKKRRMNDEIPGEEAKAKSDDDDEETEEKGKKGKGKKGKEKRPKGRPRKKPVVEDDDDDELEDLEGYDGEMGDEMKEGGVGMDKIPNHLWPVKRVLNLRIKSLMDKIDRLRKAEERQRQRDEKSKQREEKKKTKQDQLEKEREERLKKRKIKQAEKSKKNQERKKEWSKRERQDLRTAVMAHGISNWELIKEKARLNNKDVDTIEEYWIGLYAYAQQLVKEYPNPYSAIVKGRKKVVKKVSKPKTEEEKEGGEEHKEKEKEEKEKEKETEEKEDNKEKTEMEDDEGEGDLEVDEEEEEDEEEGGEKPKEGGAEGKEEEGENKKEGHNEEEEEEDDKNSEENPYMITPIVAHRLVDRVNLWTDIREKILPNPQLKELLEDMDAEAMPFWWYPGEHDYILLKSIDKYGIGNMGGEWDPFLKDKECPFISKNKPSGPVAARKQKETFLLKFVEDRFPLISRLNFYRRKLLGTLDTEPLDSDERRGRGKKRGRALLAPGTDENSIYSKNYRTGGRERKRRRGADDEPEPEPPSSTPQPPPVQKADRVIYRDKNGDPVLPIRLKGGVTVHKLGRIEFNRPGFHSKQYLWPVGFESTRRFPSIQNPSQVIKYTSRIVDKGGAVPSFEVEAEDLPGQPFCHSTSSGVWVHVLKQVKNKASVSVSGPEMFGYSDPIIKKLFQELPNADKCKGYITRELNIPTVTKEDAEGDEEDEGEAEMQIDEEDEENEEETTPKPQKAAATRKSSRTPQKGRGGQTPTTRRKQTTTATTAKTTTNSNKEEIQKLMPVLKALQSGLGMEEEVSIDSSIPEEMQVEQIQQRVALLKEKLKQQLEGNNNEDEEEEDEEEMEVVEEEEEEEGEEEEADVSKEEEEERKEKEEENGEEEENDEEEEEGGDNADSDYAD